MLSEPMSQLQGLICLVSGGLMMLVGFAALHMVAIKEAAVDARSLQFSGLLTNLLNWLDDRHPGLTIGEVEALLNGQLSPHADRQAGTPAPAMTQREHDMEMQGRAAQARGEVGNTPARPFQPGSNVPAFNPGLAAVEDPAQRPGAPRPPTSQDMT